MFIPRNFTEYIREHNHILAELRAREGEPEKTVETYTYEDHENDQYVTFEYDYDTREVLSVTLKPMRKEVYRG